MYFFIYKNKLFVVVKYGGKVCLSNIVPKRSNIYTYKLRNVGYLQVPRPNASYKYCFRFGLTIHEKNPKVPSSGETINKLKKHNTVWLIESENVDVLSNIIYFQVYIEFVKF